MMNNQLKQILYEYANTKGVGMPLTAEEMLNAISNWLVTVLPECIDIETTTLAAGAEATATLTGSGTPDDHYVLKLGIPQGGKGDPGTPGKQGTAGIGFSDSADMTFTPTTVTYSGGKARLAGNLNVTDGSTVSPELTFDLPIEAGNGVTVDVNEAGNGITISAEGGGSAPAGVELTGASGTLTAEQLRTLEASPQNYIVNGNELYTLADNEATAGYYTYSHCGIQNTNQTFIKCITITVSTRRWTKTTVEVPKIYLHNLNITSSSKGLNATMQIYSTDKTPINTSANLDNILNNFSYKPAICSGFVRDSGAIYSIYGIFSTNNPPFLNVSYLTSDTSQPTKNVSFNDGVIVDTVVEM